MAILLGSLAFWLNQPAYLFNGGASSTEAATEATPDRNSTPRMHGLLSLELLSAMQRSGRRPLPRHGMAAATRCERQPSTAASLALRHVSVLNACTRRVAAR